MQKIAGTGTSEHQNSRVCRVVEHSFAAKVMDLCVIEITGRYPDFGYGRNTECASLIYILEGTGELVSKKEKIAFAKGDSLLILPREEYAFETEGFKGTMVCSPAWSPDQYESLD